jgi:small subunit ribosomal protein S20
VPFSVTNSNDQDEAVAWRTSSRRSSATGRTRSAGCAKRRLRNKSVKSSLKTAIRKFHEAAASGDTEQATTLMRDASRKLDKAVSKGVIHKNQAANRKSAISHKLNGLAA